MPIKAELYPWISAGIIAWGLLDCFYGYRVFKVTLGIVGGLVGAALGQAGGVALGIDAGWLFGLMIGAGLLGAGLAFLLYTAAVFVAGFGFGATLGILLLTQYNHMVASLSGLVLGIVGGFLAVKIQRILIILSTALLGSFRAIFALAYFITGLKWATLIQKPQDLPVVIEQTPWMFPCILGMAVAGIIAQLELGGGSTKKKSATAAE